MKFYYCILEPDRRHPDGSFTRTVTAFTTETPDEPGRPAFIRVKIIMTPNNQSTEVIKSAIEEKVGEPIEIAGGFHFTMKLQNYTQAVNKIFREEAEKENKNYQAGTSLFGAHHVDFPEVMLSIYQQEGLSPKEAVEAIKSENEASKTKSKT